MTDTPEAREAPPRPDPGPAGAFLDHLEHAAALVEAGRFADAEEAVLLGLSMAPSDTRALKLLAVVRFKLGRLEDARDVCRRIAAELPDDARIRMNLGLIALKLDRLDESVDELEASARLAPEDLRPWSYLGFVHARRGQSALAAAAFRRAGQEAFALEAEAGGLAGAAITKEDAGQSQVAEVAAVPASAAVADAATTTGGFDGESFESVSDSAAAVVASEPPTDPIRPRWAQLSASAGGLAVSPLVTYAVSRLAPPADQPAWVGAAARVAIGDGMFVRGDAVVACTGLARWEPAYRHVRGRATPERLGGDDRPFFHITGRGELFVAAPVGRSVPLRLDDDTLYIREDRVLAFEGGVGWEYGHVPRGNLRMLQFRGRGLVAIQVAGEPGAVKVTPDKPMFAAAPYLLGWIGRVVAHGGEPGDMLAPTSSAPHPDSAPSSPFGITCEGEGVVLIDLAEGARS